MADGRLLSLEGFHRPWRDLPDEHKSYSVELLYYFHYRPSRAKKSWVMEETLTWELMRVLDLGPRDVLLAEFLKAAGKVSKPVHTAVQPLVCNPTLVDIVPYPILACSGEYAKKRADIGFELDGTPRLWIEVKTEPFKGMRDEVDIQAEILRRRCSEAVVLTLLPKGTNPQGTDCMTWGTVVKVFDVAFRRLRKSEAPESFLVGYQKMLQELRNRVAGHIKPLL